jgi:hypothetical protein
MAELDKNIDPAKKGSYEFSKLETYGDLKKIIKMISLQQKGGKIVSQGVELALDQVLGLIPGASNAKTAFDFIKSAVSKPDTKKTDTWLDKLDIDDEMSAIVDDTIENGFMKAMAASIEAEPNDKSLEPDFNMNAKMVNYLKQQYQGRTVAGIKEDGSTSGDAGAFLTPQAFMGKKKGDNRATKTANSQGMKKAKKPTKSKVVDYKKIWESDYDKASISSQASGYTAASGYTGVGKDSHQNQYYKEATDKKSRRFIPTEFEFPSFLLKPIEIGNKSKVYFKVATNANNESVLMIDPLVATALDAVERGRSSFDKEINLPALTRYIKEKIPAEVRGLIKKAAQGAKIGSNGFIALPLVLSKSPNQGTSVTNNKVSISEKGISLLKAIKADPTKGEGLENELGFLVWVYKHQNGTPKEYASDNGVSTQLASRLTNKSVANGTINMEKGETEEPTGDNWYIKTPFGGGEREDINTKLYESVDTIVKEELLNESSYNRFKREVSFRTKSEQLHKAIREVKRKLAEIDRIVEYTSRMKQELSEGEDGIRYWKATERNVATISEMVNHLNNKIKNLQQ